mmetsp:Transcript_18556/g.60462  ORF Transcript_18556/g.60462 Transcript_18556/m.60462 type:complete len:259 (-) Transcript_18556:811-1587(-)
MMASSRTGSVASAVRARGASSRARLARSSRPTHASAHTPTAAAAATATENHRKPSRERFVAEDELLVLGEELSDAAHGEVAGIGVEKPVPLRHQRRRRRLRRHRLRPHLLHAAHGLARAPELRRHRSCRRSRRSRRRRGSRDRSGRGCGRRKLEHTRARGDAIRSCAGASAAAAAVRRVRSSFARRVDDAARALRRLVREVVERCAPGGVAAVERHARLLHPLRNLLGGDAREHVGLEVLDEGGGAHDVGVKVRRLGR